MDQRIVEFITALRSSGVRVSLAESKDAFEAIQQMGVQDREAFKIALRTTLIKEMQDFEKFDELFPLYFTTNQPRMEQPSENLTPEEAQELARAIRQYAEQLRRMMEKMMDGKPLSDQELSQLDRMVNMDDVTDMRYQNWKAKQMEQALRFREVQEAMEALMQMLQQMGMDKERLEEMREQLQANQQALQDQIRQHVGQRIMANKNRQSPQERLDSLYNRPFQSLTEDDMRMLHKEVTRLAAVLRTRLALRLKKANTGQLDVKATLRNNLKYGSVPLDIRHRDHTRKPKIVILCDVSTSMRHVSELMLSLLYAIQDQISKTHAFSFIDHLEYISPDFGVRRPDEAISDVLRKMPSGHYNTDLGSCLESLRRDYMDTVDNRSTFIVVGDARNNYNDPRTDVFGQLARRSRHTIWLNPENPTLWDTGDSDMNKYAPHCERVFQVSNLAQLTQAIDHLLLNH